MPRFYGQHGERGGVKERVREKDKDKERARETERESACVRERGSSNASVELNERT